VPALQFGLRIEKIHLAGRAFHEEEDDVLRARFEVRSGTPFDPEKVSESRCADAAGRIAEELPP
jgi:hypothetical protein